MAIPSSALSLVRTFVLLFAAIAALFVIDTVMARMERAESRASAARAYSDGMRLMQQHKYLDAEDRFKEGISLARDNAAYTLALAQAQLAAGQLPEAESTLSDLLLDDGTGGAQNLAMARVLAKEGKVMDAISYYHRAIFGRWPANAARNRVQARSELVDFLVAHDFKEDLLAELLPLQQEEPDDISTQKKLALAFIASGSPARAATLFREILRRQPDDPEIHIGLGEAELASGNYRTARANFELAVRENPADETSRKRMELCDQVLALDPAQRGLSAADQFQRSRKILDLAVSGASACLAAPLADPAKTLIESAATRLKQTKPGATADAMESNMQLAEQISQIRRAECKAAPATAEDLVLRKGTQ